MESMHWPLAIFSRCVAHKNLSAAAVHVGLSQPQLSRIVANLESHFNLVLLDRSAKRKSGWTPAALRLAEIVNQSQRRLNNAIQELQLNSEATQIHIGALEGVSDLVLRFCHQIYKHSRVKLIQVDVVDLIELEEKFLNGELDLIFTSRLPGKQKFKHVIEVGYQTLEEINTDPETYVLSPFQYTRLSRSPSSRKLTKKVFITNSLHLRGQWLSQYGGMGNLPSKVEKRKGKNQAPVYLIAGELFNARLWSAIENDIELFD